jgi:two-component sensor histidine kinase
LCSDHEWPGGARKASARRREAKARTVSRTIAIEGQRRKSSSEGIVKPRIGSPPIERAADGGKSTFGTKSADQEPEAAAQLKNAACRVITVARVHRRLHVLDHIDAVELSEYLTGLCEEITGMLAIDGSSNVVTVEGIAITVPTAIGIPLAFVVSELVTNSAKYAGGKITVHLANVSDGIYALSVSDEGPGLPENFDPRKTSGLGMMIVSTLVKNIGGTLVCGTNDSGKGARFTVLFDATDSQ